jgi:hypothetical protein
MGSNRPKSLREYFGMNYLLGQAVDPNNIHPEISVIQPSWPPMNAGERG